MREITPMTGKETSGKLNLSLVPPEIINAVAHIREYGCRKYDSPDNWKDVDPEMFNQAMQRHVMACWNDWGAIDEESKMPHIWHIACNVAFLCQFLKDEELEAVKEDMEWLESL